MQYPSANERDAWMIGLMEYNYRSREQSPKEAILSGKSRGLFALLNKPGEATATPRIIDIVQFGLLSYRYNPSESIPPTWLEPDKLQELQNKADEMHLQAKKAYEEMKSIVF